MDHTIAMNRIEEAIGQSVAVKQAVLGDTGLRQRIALAAQLIEQCLRNGGKVHFCGNGGSAADAQHLAAELSGRFYFERPPLNAEALHCNTSYLTAVGNDYGYEQVFARLLRGTAHKGDVLVGISTSGNSRNIIEAYKVCRELGIDIISLTGHEGGQMRTYGGVLLNAPSTDTPRIQECHIMMGHIVCELVETALFK